MNTYEVSCVLEDGTISPVKLHYSSFRMAVEILAGFQSPQYKASLRLNDGQGHEYTVAQAIALVEEIDATRPTPAGGVPAYTHNAVNDIIAAVISRVCEMPEVRKGLWKGILREHGDESLSSLDNEYGRINLNDLPAMHLADIVQKDPEIRYLLVGDGDELNPDGSDPNEDPT